MKIMKLIINRLYFDEVDGVKLISIIEEDLKLFFYHIKDLEYQADLHDGELNINITFHNEVKPVKRAVDSFLNILQLNENQIISKIIDLSEEGGEYV